MIRKAALLTLLTALLAPAGMAGTAVAAPQARLAAAADPLVVEEISPDVVRDPATPITISGTVTGTPLASVKVQVDYSGQPFRLRSDLRRYLDGEGYFTPQYRTKVQATPLDQSGKLTFQFTVPELRMTQLGVYPLAIEVVDAVTRQRIAIERTFMPFVPPGQTGQTGQKVPKMKLAVALPIADRPHLAVTPTAGDGTAKADPTFMDDDLRSSAATGRLAKLLKVVQQADDHVTWFVDPSLLQDAKQASAGPYVVKAGDGDGEHKTADPGAGRWLDGLRTALTDKPAVAMPYADPDMAALVHNGLERPAVAAIQRGTTLASELLGREVNSGTLWPAGGVIDRDAIDELAMAGVTSVLMSGDALPPATAAPDATGATGATTGTAGGAATGTPDPAAKLDTVAETPLTALLADPALSEVLDTNVSTPGSVPLARQRWLAETAMIAFEQAPATGTTGGSGAAPSRTVVAAPTNHLWNPDPDFVATLLQASTSAPWLRMTSLASVKPGKSPAPRTDLVYSDRDRQAELGRAYLSTVRKLDEKADAAATVTVEHTELFHEAILRLCSAAWRGDAKQATAFADTVGAAVGDRLDDVAMIDTPRSVAGSNGQVPVSVTNNLDRDILVKLRVTSDNRALLDIDRPGGVYDFPKTTVAKGRSQLFNVPVIVPAKGGEASIAIQLLTADDKRYGDPVHVAVRATGYTSIALVIVGAAVVIMLAAVVMRILRRRSRKAFPFGPTDGTDPDPGDAPAVPAEQDEVPPRSV
ncbi:hypothetical protein [Microbispora sp. NPDC049125]|uniref:hypothetical protein n=1 Tax=Microbispora sp. NPDC049125 TaxID=3154929 RepID=UPI0034669D3C